MKTCKPLPEVVPRHSDTSVLFLAIASSPEEPTQLQKGESKGVISRAPAAAPRRKETLPGHQQLLQEGKKPFQLSACLITLHAALPRRVTASRKGFFHKYYMISFIIQKVIQMNLLGWPKSSFGFSITSYRKESQSKSHSVVSNSLPPHGPYGPWNSLDQDTGVGSLSLFQRIFPTQGSNPGLPHCSRVLYQLSHQGSPRTLDWLA